MDSLTFTRFPGPLPPLAGRQDGGHEDEDPDEGHRPDGRDQDHLLGAPGPGALAVARRADVVGGGRGPLHLPRGVVLDRLEEKGEKDIERIL